MKILALDFSTSQRSVAVVQPLGGSAPVFQSEMLEAGGRSTRAFGLIQRALAEARLEPAEIDCLAVGLGPGSYTGIRAALAIAQGWQLARDVRLCGLRTVDVLAAQVQAEGWRGEVHLVLDAQRGEFYCSTWDLGDGQQRSETRPLRLVARNEVESLLVGGATMVCGPDLKGSFPLVRELYPSARQLGRMVLGGDPVVEGDQLAPIYLRPVSFAKSPPGQKRSL